MGRGMGQKNRKWTDKDYKHIKNEYMKGTSMAQIARKFDVTSTTISKKLVEMGVKK